MFKRTLIGLTIAAAIVLVVPVTAMAMKVSDGSAFSSQPTKPLVSEKTFGLYHSQVGVTGQERRALMLRSEGLNKKYGLGDYATGMSAQERRALMLRSEGLNKKYGLGDYATTTVVSEKTTGLQQPGQPEQPAVVASNDNEFNWGDAGIGAGAIFVGIILAAGAAFAVRHRHTPIAH